MVQNAEDVTREELTEKGPLDLELKVTPNLPETVPSSEDRSHIEKG